MARKMIMKLSAAYDKPPSSLSLAGPITDRGEHATAHGGFGDIYKAVYAETPVALKCMRTHLRGNELRQMRQKFYQEALVWRYLQHRFILPLFGVDVETFSPFPCMVTPWMKHGTVLECLDEYGRGNVDKFLCEIAQGLQYLHAQKIIHGDLRGANILVTDDWSACLADFGLAQFSVVTSTVSSLNRGGTLRWMAPELLNPGDFGLQFNRTIATDIYAFGCTCLELYTGRPPFHGLSDGAVIHQVIAGERPAQPTGDRAMSDVLWEHINQYWTQDPAARPPTEILVKNTNDLMTVMTQHQSHTPDTTEHESSALIGISADDIVLKLASSIGFQTNKALRDGLQSDYARALARVVDVINTPETANAILGLMGDDAQDFVDDLQGVSSRLHIRTLQ
ncbi:kinase-like domain-containing protein [Mycena polygramma]|nr:kinase-like domain-containing protein [Mycena polygramma]